MMHHDPTQVTLDEIPTYLLQKLYIYFKILSSTTIYRLFIDLHLCSYNARPVASAGAGGL